MRFAYGGNGKKAAADYRHLETQYSKEITCSLKAVAPISPEAKAVKSKSKSKARMDFTDQEKSAVDAVVEMIAAYSGDDRGDHLTVRASSKVSEKDIALHVSHPEGFVVELNRVIKLLGGLSLCSVIFSADVTNLVRPLNIPHVAIIGGHFLDVPIDLFIHITPPEKALNE